MKAYTIKSSGATIDRNILWEVRQNFKKDTWYHTGIIFFKKRHAKEYLETLNYKEFYKIISLEVENVKEDNRLTKKQP